MKKRFLSMILCVSTLLVAVLSFSACSSNGFDSVIKATDAKAQTIVIAAIKGEKTTDEAVKAVEDALNEITKAKFNTQVILKLFTPDEYVSQIMNMFQRMEARQQMYEDGLQGNTTGSSDSRYDLIDDTEKQNYQVQLNGDLTYADEFGRPVTVYPKVNDDQIDIVFIDSIETYYKLLDNEYIISLSDDITANTDISKSVSSAFLTQLRKLGNGFDQDGIFAVPNGYVVRDYDYILVNKKLYDYYQYDIKCDLTIYDGMNRNGCDDLTDFAYFLEEVAANNDTIADDLKVDRFLYNYTGTQWESYFGDGQNTCLVLPSTSASFNLDLTPKVDSLFSRSLFKKTQSLLYTLRSQYNETPYEGECFFMDSEESVGYAIPAANMADNKETFAVAMVSGDNTVPNYYNSDDYYVVKISTPIFDNELFQSMFAVSTFSSTAVNADGISIQNKIANYSMQRNPRCFELISMLQTDAEAVNLLTYGVQGVNYDVYEDDDTAYNVGKNGYQPVLGKMGNIFLCRPYDGMDQKSAYYASNDWKAAKTQTRYAIASPYCGLMLRDVEEAGVDIKCSQIDEFFTKFYEENMPKIKNFNGYDENGKEVTIEEYIAAIDSELKRTTEYKMGTQAYKKQTENYDGPTYESLPVSQAMWHYNFIQFGHGDYV